MCTTTDENCRLWSGVRSCLRRIWYVLLVSSIGFLPAEARADGEKIHPDAFLTEYRRIIKEHQATYSNNVRIEGKARFERHGEPPPGKADPGNVSRRSITDNPWPRI